MVVAVLDLQDRGWELCTGRGKPERREQGRNRHKRDGGQPFSPAAGTDHPGGGRRDMGFSRQLSPTITTRGSSQSSSLCHQAAQKAACCTWLEIGLESLPPQLSSSPLFSQDAGQLLKQTAGSPHTHPLLMPTISPDQAGVEYPRMNDLTLASTLKSILSAPTPAA